MSDSRAELMDVLHLSHNTSNGEQETSCLPALPDSFKPLSLLEQVVHHEVFFPAISKRKTGDSLTNSFGTKDLVVGLTYLYRLVWQPNKMIGDELLEGLTREEVLKRIQDRIRTSIILQCRPEGIGAICALRSEAFQLLNPLQSGKWGFYTANSHGKYREVVIVSETTAKADVWFFGTESTNIKKVDKPKVIGDLKERSCFVKPFETVVWVNPSNRSSYTVWMYIGLLPTEDGALLWQPGGSFVVVPVGEILGNIQKLFPDEHAYENGPYHLRNCFDICSKVLEWEYDNLRQLDLGLFPVPLLDDIRIVDGSDDHTFASAAWQEICKMMGIEGKGAREEVWKFVLMCNLRFHGWYFQFGSRQISLERLYAAVVVLRVKNILKSDVGIASQCFKKLFEVCNTEKQPLPLGYSTWAFAYLQAFAFGIPSLARFSDPFIVCPLCNDGKISHLGGVKWSCSNLCPLSACACKSDCQKRCKCSKCWFQCRCESHHGIHKRDPPPRQLVEFLFVKHLQKCFPILPRDLCKMISQLLSGTERCLFVKAASTQ